MCEHVFMRDAEKAASGKLTPQSPRDLPLFPVLSDRKQEQSGTDEVARRHTARKEAQR